MYIIKSTCIDALWINEPFEIKLTTAEETAEYCEEIGKANIGYIVLYQEKEKWIDWIIEYNKKEYHFNNTFSIPKEFQKLLKGGLILKDEEGTKCTENEEEN